MKKVLYFLFLTLMFSSCIIIPQRNYYTNYPKSGRQIMKGKKGDCNMFPRPLKEFKRR